MERHLELVRSTKEAWLEGPSDLKEDDVFDVPVPGQSVRVRGLPASYSNQASSEALRLMTDRHGDQTATVDTAVMEVLQFHHGVIEPRFTIEESRKIAQRFGPAFKKVIARIDELSGVDKEALEKAEATFPAGERGQNGTATPVEVQPPAGDS